MGELKAVSSGALGATSGALDKIDSLFPGIRRMSIARAEKKADKKLFEHLRKLDEWGSKYEIDSFIIEGQKEHAMRFHRKASNFASIAAAAAPRVTVDASTESVDAEWRDVFRDCAENVSDEYVQGLWAKILAGEINNPGTYSKRTLLALQGMSRGEIENIVRLASLISFVKKGDTLVPYVIELRKEDADAGLSQEDRRLEIVDRKSRFELIDLGLAHELSWGSFSVAPGEGAVVMVGEEKLIARNPLDEPIKCTPCHYRLTKVGIDLLSLCDRFGFEPGLADTVSEVLSTWGFEVSRAS